jgi:hypothetical protein
MGAPHPSAAPVFMDPPSRIAFHDNAIFTKENPLKQFDETPRQVFCVEVRQITTGTQSSQCLLFEAVVFSHVTADAALGCGAPRKANGPKGLVILRPSYPLNMRKSYFKV